MRISENVITLESYQEVFEFYLAPWRLDYGWPGDQTITKRAFFGWHSALLKANIADYSISFDSLRLSEYWRKLSNVEEIYCYYDFVNGDSERPVDEYSAPRREDNPYLLLAQHIMEKGVKTFTYYTNHKGYQEIEVICNDTDICVPVNSLDDPLMFLSLLDLKLHLENESHKNGAIASIYEMIGKPLAVADGQTTNEQPPNGRPVV